MYTYSSRVFSRSLSANPRRPSTLRNPLISAFIVLGAGTATYYFRGAPTVHHPSLSYQHFTPTRIISTEESGPHTKLLKIAIAPDLLPPRDLFDPIWSVYIKDDDIQVERPYTPLQGVDENGHMMFWIKKYPKGEVGRWLHSKNTDDKIELRGPIKTWTWKQDSWDEVVMVCVLPSLQFSQPKGILDLRRYRNHTFRPAFPQSYFTTHQVAKYAVHPDSFLSCTCRTPSASCSRTAYCLCSRKCREIYSSRFRRHARWIQFSVAYTSYKYRKDHRLYLGTMFAFRTGVGIMVANVFS
jgi:hypothetical protein